MVRRTAGTEIFRRIVETADDAADALRMRGFGMSAPALRPAGFIAATARAAA
jgi:hypothetical protein